MIKLTTLKGAENLPKKKEICFCGEPCQCLLYNSAVSQIEECGISVDVEKLQNILDKVNPFGQEIKGESYNEYLAQALAQSSAEWLRLERVE